MVMAGGNSFPHMENDRDDTPRPAHGRAAPSCRPAALPGPSPQRRPRTPPPPWPPPPANGPRPSPPSRRTGRGDPGYYLFSEDSMRSSPVGPFLPVRERGADAPAHLCSAGLPTLATAGAMPACCAIQQQHGSGWHDDDNASSACGGVCRGVCGEQRLSPGGGGPVDHHHYRPHCRSAPDVALSCIGIPALFVICTLLTAFSSS